jgi:hypothetical protein
MTTVNVYIISTEKPDQMGGISPQAKRLYELFASPIFQTTILKLDTTPKNIKTDYPGFDQKASNELYRFILSLKDGTSQSNKEPILFITDTSVTNADASVIESIITSLLTNKWDICYLSKWLDSCDLYSNKKLINNNGTILVDAVNPHGIQALLIRPDNFSVNPTNGEVSWKGTKIDFEKDISTTFQKLIFNKSIVAATVTPNLFNVDPNTITNPSDYVKLNECRNIDTNAISTSENPNLITYILMGIVILLLLFLILRK